MTCIIIVAGRGVHECFWLGWHVECMANDSRHSNPHELVVDDTEAFKMEWNEKILGLIEELEIFSSGKRVSHTIFI